MRRRDFTIGLLLAVATQSVRAQGPSKQHRIAIVITTGPVSRIDDPGSHFWHPFWEELRRLGYIEGQNLAVERYAGEGRTEGYADLFYKVVNQNPDVIVAHDQIVRAARTATSTIPVVVVGGLIQYGLAASLLARAATSLGSATTQGTRSGASASRSFRKPSLRQPRSRSSEFTERIPQHRRFGTTFGKRADNCKSR